MRSIFYIIISIFFVGIFAPSTAFAALDLVNLTTNPKSPGEDQDVKVRIESYAVNLNTANLIWYVNSEPIKEGIAEKELTVHTGNFGTKTTIDVIILTADGKKINKQLVIAPAEVDLLWEAQTYVPPFYKGKALPTYKSLVRVTAIPRFNAATSDPKEYYYKWTYNKVQGAGEALSKNSVVIPMNFVNTSVPINVNVKLPGTEWEGQKTLNITAIDPKIVFYQQSPVLGINFDHAFVGGATKETEFNIYAAPYFFSLDNLLNNQLLFTWKLDRNNTTPDFDQRNLTLVKPSEKASTHEVSLRIQNTKRILQDASTQSLILFAGEK